MLRLAVGSGYRVKKEMLPRWLVTVRVELPSPYFPTMRRPSLTELKLPLAKEPREIYRVDGAVATSLNPEVNGIRMLILPLMDAKR